MIRRIIALFAALIQRAAPAPLPELAPMPGTSAYHQRRAHRAGTATHMSYGRWMVGHDCVTPEEIVRQAEEAAAEWGQFAIRLREEIADVDVPDSPEGLAGGSR